MQFSVDKSIEVLEKTPQVLTTLLSSLSSDWIVNNEGEGTWSPYDVIGHLIHSDKTNWIPRIEIILSDKRNKEFPPFDRFAQFENSKEKNIGQLLNEFEKIRDQSIKSLKAFKISESDLIKTGVHPAFGEVTLSQQIATWVAHDLDHISQITRVMAKQYKKSVGPWVEYLKILKQT